MNLVIYGHGSSKNHGNEAIVRGIRNLFPQAQLTVYTFDMEADKHFELDKICILKPMTKNISKKIFLRGAKRVLKKFSFVKKMYYKELFHPFIEEIDPDTIYLLEAGDQYCELGEHRFYYALLNNIVHRMGAKSVMLGCTINPDLFQNKELIDDLNRYDAIIARESITYDAMLESHLKTKVLIAPCPAFSMKAEESERYVWMEKKKFVAFNIGFLQQGNEKYFNLLMRNYKKAIQMVLEETSYDIALIPHVNWSYQTTDFTALDELYREFEMSGKVHLVDEHNAAQQKFYISKAEAFVSLRTHAAISGLSGCVPTLITGYKTKSKGIAGDVFRNEFDMLADVQSLDNDMVISQKLRNILQNKLVIKEYLIERMPDYISNLSSITDTISAL